MKRRLNTRPLLFILTVLLLWTFSTGRLYSRETYPGTTIYFLPSIETNLLIPFAENRAPGGSAVTGLSVRGLIFDPLVLGLQGEYRFHTNSDTAEAAAGFGLDAGWDFILKHGFTLSPEAGLNLMFPINTSEDIFAELELDCTANLHLWDRSKLYITTGLHLPFPEGQPVMFSLGFGIKESNPVMIPLPDVKPLLSLSTDLFSPDNNGEDDELIISMTAGAPSSIETWTLNILDRNNNPVVSREGSTLPAQNNFIWDGFSDTGSFVSSADDYAVVWQVTDRLGRSSLQTVSFVIDVLIFNVDGKLKINIPNIIFPPQSADFAMLTEAADIEKNNDILERLAVIFKRFADYSILIEGHANAEHWQSDESLAREQRDELLPLSLSRAEMIKKGLIKLGINENRINVEGLGAAMPIVPFDDAENNWKNRRVEFILVK